jgi:hypothetical protein
VVRKYAELITMLRPCGIRSERSLRPTVPFSGHLIPSPRTALLRPLRVRPTMSDFSRCGAIPYVNGSDTLNALRSDLASTPPPPQIAGSTTNSQHSTATLRSAFMNCPQRVTLQP